MIASGPALNALRSDPLVGVVYRIKDCRYETEPQLSRLRSHIVRDLPT